VKRTAGAVFDYPSVTFGDSTPGNCFDPGKWTGGIPDTQVTVVGVSIASGVNVAFLCAAPVGAGQLTIPAYVLLNLPPTGSSPVPGQPTAGNRSVSLFAASGLELGWIAYSQGYTLSRKYQ
jgi:hypothetical protein